MLKHINVYPLKSAGGFSVTSSQIDNMGLEFDRRFMVVDEYGMFVSQRSDHGMGIGIRSMRLIKTAVIGGHTLYLTAVGVGPLTLPFAGRSGKNITVQVWDSVFEAWDQGKEASLWISKFLSRERPGKYKIVRIPPSGPRTTNRGDAQVGFADGYPALGISQESLDDLNKRMSLPLQIQMDRFRTNFVFSGGEAYIEDYMKRISIGDVLFDGVKLCTRCAITTFDPVTGTVGKEPLKTLATYRKGKKGVHFGTNFNHLDTGMVTVGDVVSVLDQAEITE